MSDTQKVYCVRHGQTVSNKDGLVQGFDSALSEVGQAQAKIIAERLSKIHFDFLLSSDMPRALNTAGEIALATHKEVIPEPLLREILPDTQYVGNPFSAYADVWHVPPATLDEHRMPWGASARELVDRARAVLKKVATYDGDVVAVTHGAFLSMLAVAAIWEDPTVESIWGLYLKLRRSNTGITVFECTDSDWKLVTWNDHAHLG